MSNRNGLRIMQTETLLWKEIELKMQSQWFSKSRKIWDLLTLLDRQLGSVKWNERRCWKLVETVWLILHFLAMGRIKLIEHILEIIRRWASWVKIKNLAGWWAQSAKWYSTACWGFSGSRCVLMNWPNWDGGTRPTTCMRVIWSTVQPNWEFQ